MSIAYEIWVGSTKEDIGLDAKNFDGRSLVVSRFIAEVDNVNSGNFESLYIGWIRTQKEGGYKYKPENTFIGDRIANATKAIGIKPCGGCKKRQKALNKADRKVREIANKIKARILK